MPELVLPSERHKASFLEAALEIAVTEPSYNEGKVNAAGFDAYLRRAAQYAAGQGVAEGHVPSTEWWLVDGSRWLGRVSIRHRLNDRLEREGGHIGYIVRPSERGKGYGNLMMELALSKARELGITRALVTCDDGNASSARIIEKHGGMLENKVSREGESGLTRRYWITL